MHRRDRYEMLMDHIKDWARNQKVSNRHVNAITIKMIEGRVEATAVVTIKPGESPVRFNWNCDQTGVNYKGSSPV